VAFTVAKTVAKAAHVTLRTARRSRRPPPGGAPAGHGRRCSS
jgi:hypothetical protein